MTSARWIPGLASALVLAAAPAHAGAVFELESRRGSETETITLSAEGKNLKIDVPSAEGSDQPDQIIFRGDRGEMIAIDHDASTFISIDREQLESLRSLTGGGADDGASLMEQALASVPPEQRAMVERMMRERMQAAGQVQLPAASAPKVEYRSTGERAERAGYASVQYQGVSDGEVVRELWVSEWDRIEGGAQVRDALRAWGEFWNDSLTRVTGENPFAIFNQAAGFPVDVRELEGGEVTAEFGLRNASERDLEPGTFDPPAEYERQQMGL